MPSARVNGGPHAMPPWARVAIVVVYADGTRVITEVTEAQQTVEAEYHDLPWWHGLPTMPSRMRIKLEGYLGEGRPFEGDLPEQQAIGEAPRAIEAARRHLEP